MDKRQKLFNLYKSRSAKHNPARKASSDYLSKVVKTSAVSDFTSKMTGIPYAIIGGHAIVIHGSPRTTQDVDLLVMPADLQRAQKALGGTSSGPLTVGGVAMSVNGTEVDLVAPPVPWVADAIREAIDSEYGKVVSKPYLVLMKLWASRGAQEDLDMMYMLKAMTPEERKKTIQLVRKHLPNDVEDLKNMIQYSKYT